MWMQLVNLNDIAGGIVNSIFYTAVNGKTGQKKSARCGVNRFLPQRRKNPIMLQCFVKIKSVFEK